MSSCKKFSNSIHPATIPKSNKEIKALLQCLFDDSILYLDSAEKFSKFINHFQKSILPKLEEKNLFKKFAEVVSRYAQTELIKTTFVATNLACMHAGFIGLYVGSMLRKPVKS